jgi:hypothetical protein
MTKHAWFKIIVITAILMLVMAFPGCGKKGDPISPKDYSPRAIFDHGLRY